MSSLINLKDRSVRCLEGLVVLLMGGLVLDVLWQVTSRYLLRRPSAWTDELATLLVIWLALLTRLATGFMLGRALYLLSGRRGE